MKIDRPAGLGEPEKAADGRVERADKPSESFADKLHGTSPAAEAVAPPGIDDIEALVAQVRAGELTMDGLLETLVERVASSSPLGPHGRDELRSILMAVLDSDPTLRGLTRAIEQAPGGGR
ncbi:MAG: hypothetical protein HYY06_08785 [Deltaproteobacteria bacterium]|nr:hypothetical protein [Deltaproteobacteria bacterium]